MDPQNLISAGALIISLFALVATFLSRRDSERSADAAQVSAEASQTSAREAQRTNDLLEAERDERLAAQDREAVDWNLRLIDTDRYLLTNIGTERAVGVRIDGPEITVVSAKDVIPPRGFVDFYYLPPADGGSGGTVTYRRDGSDREYVYKLPL